MSFGLTTSIGEKAVSIGETLRMKIEEIQRDFDQAEQRLRDAFAEKIKKEDNEIQQSEQQVDEQIRGSSRIGRLISDGRRLESDREELQRAVGEIRRDHCFWSTWNLQPYGSDKQEVNSNILALHNRVDSALFFIRSCMQQIDSDFS